MTTTHDAQPTPEAGAEAGAEAAAGAVAENSRARLITGSIPGHLVSQTAPGIVGVLATMSVGVIDAYFIGQLGSDELAAISFIFPVITALSSLGVGIMVGVSAVVSRALGEGEEARARGRANLGILTGVAAGLIFGATLYLTRQPLFALMQAEPQVLVLIEEYIRPFAMVFPLLLIMMAVNGVLRGQGLAKSSTLVLLAYAAVNWVLDPIFITGIGSFEGFGMAGAAYATGCGWVVALMTAFALLARGEIRFNPGALRGRRWGVGLRALLKVAIPASFTNSISPAAMAVLTGLVAAESQSAVAGFGAGGRIQAIALVPLLALSGSIGAIVGQNWGARLYDRAYRAIWQASLFCLAYGLLSAVALYALCWWFAGLFSDEPAVIAATARYLQISVWGYAGFGVLIMINGALNAVDRANTALVLSLARVFLVMLPFALFMRPTWGAEAIFSAELIANLLGGVVAAAIGWRVFRKAAR